MSSSKGFWDGLPLFPEQASTLAREVDALYLFGVAVAIFFSLLVGALWSLLATWLLMLAVYVLLPNAKVRIRYGVVGALVAAVWLETGKRTMGAYLENARYPSRKVNEIDNRGSTFYLTLYWARALASQDDDADLKARFAKLADELSKNESSINKELLAAQGQPVDGPAAGDEDQPGGDGGTLAVVPFGLPPHLDESLLQDLLGIRPVAQDALGEAQQHAREAVVEPRQRGAGGDPFPAHVAELAAELSQQFQIEIAPRRKRRVPGFGRKSSARGCQPRNTETGSQ